MPNEKLMGIRDRGYLFFVQGTTGHFEEKIAQELRGGARATPRTLRIAEGKDWHNFLV
jgi:hypothetical protein